MTALVGEEVMYRYRSWWLAGALLALCLGACTATPQEESDDRATSDEPRVVVLTGEARAQDDLVSLGGELAVVSGCVVVRDPAAPGDRVVLFPAGAEVRASDPPAVTYLHAVIEMGTELGPATGFVTRRDDLEERVELSEESRTALEACTSVVDEIVVVVGLRDIFLDLPAAA